MKTVAERFWGKVEKSDGCWEWQKCKTFFGYGLFRVDGKNVRAHRFSWGSINGAIPDGMCVLHHCDNPSCVNPDHLFIGTKKDNAQDRLSKGRPGSPGPAIPLMGELHQNTNLTNKDVMEIRRLCQTMTQRAIAKIYNITFQSVNLIVNRKRWSHLACP